ncbi:hypothetical protein XENOCAPTIV_014134, partial [Xenoophorus captivus]
MAEIELWQERASVLNALSEQLKQPAAEKIFLVMNKAKAACIHTLNGTMAELIKYHTESHDNIRFLRVLERHFMRRAEIEKLGRAPRWEFDRKRLFERSDYMASVCQDLGRVFQVLEEFHNIFGPELKGDKRVNEVLKKVDDLVLPFQEVTFNPFSVSVKTSWKIILQDFENISKKVAQRCAGVTRGGVTAVAETWDNMRFSVQTYFKGTQEHGVILGAVDEILLNVDSDVMNLQSMAGSRFVGPFLDTIQRWEKDLSLISETIE